MRDIKPIIPAQGYPPKYNISEAYLVDSLHTEWQQFDNKEGEYRDYRYYTFNPELALELINSKYAELLDIRGGIKPEYWIALRHKY